MKLTCVCCGTVNTKFDAEGHALMIVSRHTGLAYCANELACNRRAGRKMREEQDVGATTSGGGGSCGG